MSSSREAAAGDFARLFFAAYDGDQQALAEFLRRYNSTFRHMIRAHARPRLSSVVGESDLLQEIWFTIFTNKHTNYQAMPPETLMAYFQAAAANIVRNVNKKYLRVEKRSLFRERHFSAMPAGWDAPTRPTPPTQ